MLVLNRRPGESIIIEPGVVVTVLSVTDRRVWISVDAPQLPLLRVSAVTIDTTSARLDVGPLAAVTYDGSDITISIGGPEHPGVGPRATLSIDRKVDERILLDRGAWVGLGAVNKGNPCISFGGPAIGTEIAITLIRPAGNYVRLGVDAPERKVFRRELWDSVQAGEPARVQPGPASVPDGPNPAAGGGGGVKSVHDDPATGSMLTTTQAIPEPSLGS